MKPSVSCVRDIAQGSEMKMSRSKDCCTTMTSEKVSDMLFVQPSNDSYQSKANYKTAT
jgi:hypothetical protein